MSLTVHHLQNSQSERIPWLCEELNIPYDLKLYQRSPLLCPDDLASLSAMQAAPVITDTTVEPAVTLAESPAIIEYIIHRHGNGRLALPPSHPNYADYLFWFHFTNGTLSPVLGRQMILAAFQLPATDPRRALPDRKMKLALTHLDDRVGKNTWLAGEEFTAADVMIVFSLTTMRTFVQLDLSGYQGILGYLGRVAEREGYRRAMEKGDQGMDWRGNMEGKAPELFPALRKMMQRGVGGSKA